MVKVLPKIISILELFASGDELSFSEVCRKTGLTRSNASHLLQSLCEENMLEKIEYGKYRRSGRLVRLGTAANPWKELLSKAERCADNLMLWLNELAVVGMRDQAKRLTIVKRKPGKKLQVEPEGKSYPADWYTTANGRILLAYAPPDIVREIVRQCGLPERKDWREATTLPKLERELARIREQGYAALDADDIIRALGVPVRDASGEPLLSLATAFPVCFCRKKEEEIIAKMFELAGTLEAELKIGGICILDLKPQE